MLEIVKEFKKIVEKMYNLDEIIVKEKQELKNMVNWGSATLNDISAKKDIITELVFQKYNEYINLAKTQYKYEKLGIYLTLVNMMGFWNYDQTKNGNYIKDDVSNDEILKELKDRITKNYIAKNESMLGNNFTYNIDYSNLFSKLTGEDWVTKDCQTKYIHEYMHDGGIYEEDAKFYICYNKKYENLFKNKKLDCKNLIKYIQERKCVLLRKIFIDQTKDDIDEKYVLNFPLDCTKKSVYEKLYPEIRKIFWDCFNEDALQRIKDAAKNMKARISKIEKEKREKDKEIEKLKGYSTVIENIK